MTTSEIILANGKRMATDRITEDTVLRHIQRVITEESGAVATQLATYMATATPTIEMAADFTVPGLFKIQPAASAIYRVSGLKLVVVAATAPVVGSFGDIAALTNGLTLKHLDDTGDIRDLLDGQTIKTNEDLASYADIELPFATVMVARFRFPGIIRVEGTDDTERLTLTVSDNLSTITRMRVFAEGLVETTRN